MTNSIILAVGVLLASLWLWGAWLSGYFLFGQAKPAGGLADTKLGDFSQKKRLIDLGNRSIAVIDVGAGKPVILLHGCPFSAYEWRKIIPRLVASGHRVIAPDLIGLGDTPVSLKEDYRLPQDVDMVIALLDQLNIKQADFVGHDHGGATLQLLMGEHAERIRSAVLTNAEAYDQWPSKPERPYLQLSVNPLTSPFFRLALATPWMRREAFSIAYHDPGKNMHDKDIDFYVRAHTGTPERFARFRRFFKWQLDKKHNAVTMQAVPGIRRFEKPTLILWGRQDSNFGPAIARRLATDIPGAAGIEWMENSAHMPMEEEPQAYVAALENFWKRAHNPETALSQQKEVVADAQDR